MSSYIPDNIISEIRLNADILDIVSEVVNLKRTGKNYTGLCPFHSEKTPSFTVTPDKGIFHCFGCGEGGDAITFIMKTEGISFPEALRILAAKLGIEIPERSMSPGEKKTLSERETIFEINRKAADFFQQHLFKNEFAKNYLKKRGITKEIVKIFILGYAPDGWSNLHFFLRKAGFNDNVIEKSGLVVSRAQKGKSGYYDRFRNRIIFPITNINRQIIGFGGRVMDDGVPKYLNSPETPVYNKSISLYGLSEARKSIHEKGYSFVVEGYFDLIALFRHGFTNAAATLGTALTKEHVKRLKGYCEKTILIYDSDHAGVKAAERSISLFYQGNMDAYILVLPEGYDPDSYLNDGGYGPDAFSNEIEKAKPMDDFLIDSYIRKYGADGALRRIEEMFMPLLDVDDDLKLSVFTRKLSEKIGVDEAAIRDKLKDIKSKHQFRRQRQERGAEKNPLNPAREEKPSEPIIENRLEMEIVAMMLQFPDIIDVVREKNLPASFDDTALKTLGFRILEYDGDGKDFISEMLTPKNRAAGEDMRPANGFIRENRLVASLLSHINEWTFEGCLGLIDQYEIAQKQKYIRKLKRRLKEAEEKGDTDTELRILREFQECAKTMA